MFNKIRTLLATVMLLGLISAQSEVTFDLDGVDDCGFVSVTGTWDGWSGWGAHTDSGMAASIPDGAHEFIILCVNTEGEWWNDIWGSSTVYNAPIDGSCWNGNAEYPNYVLNVAGPATVSYCVGSCDATCGGGDGGADVAGCLDANATNYNPDATVQEEDQWGNLVCIYASCDDVPYEGCMYADAFAGWNEFFGPGDCVNYGGTACEESSDPSITLNVDMNCVEDIDYSGVYVNGPFTGWCGDCLPMADDDGDGVWSVTITDQPVGDLEYKYTLDGWNHQEDLIDDMVGGASCAPVTDYTSYANRIATITEGDSSTDDSYGSCEACTIEPTDTPSVTFQVDTEFVDTETGVFLAGGNIPLPEGTAGWVGLPMSDDDGDGVYEVTVELEANTYYHYKFTNGLNADWGGPYWENISSDCGDAANYNDRNFTTGDTDMTLPLVCFSSCEECEEVQVMSNVTFQVNMAGTEVSTDGVFLHGNWFGWGEIEMTDDDGDCMYETTVEVVAGIDAEYLFKNGATNEQVPEECDNINNWGGGINRLITMPDVDTVRDPICYAQCEGADCSGACGEVTITPAQVTFQVDMSENSDVTAVAVAGSFNGWGGADMLDDDGDGVYTLTVELYEGDYEYKFIGAGWSANEFEDYSFPVTADAPDCIALENCDEAGDNCQYNNRFITVGSDDIIVDEVCWASCEDCGGDPEPDTGVVFSGAFGGAAVDGNTYTNPTGSEGWAGFANEDVSLYPYSFVDGGEITFTGATAGTDADVYFRFEYNPYPDTEPSFNTAAVTVSGTDEASYSVDIPAQGANTFSSFLLYVTTLDAPVTLTDVAVASSGTDPCADVTCGDGEECVDGECVGTSATYSANFSIDTNGSDYPNADYDSVVINGSWNGWAGWGVTLADEDGDGVYTGSIDGLEDGTTVEYVVAFTGAADGWSGWGQVFGAPLASECDLFPEDEWANYGFTVAGADVDATYCAGSCEETCSGDDCTPGDVNGDDTINVLDVVQTVYYILNGGDDFPADCADMNGDGVINVLDIVQVVYQILNGRIGDDATEASLIKVGNALNLNADGYIGGVQITLSHGADFSIELTDKAMVADYRTNGNETTLIIVVPEGDELFIANGEYDIIDVIVANSAGQMDVSVVPSSFVLSAAYPNPFNPSTSINLSIPEAGHVSVMVYNIMGQLVSTLADGHMNASDYSFTWDASSVPSGLYLITATTAKQVTTQKVMLLK